MARTYLPPRAAPRRSYLTTAPTWRLPGSADVATAKAAARTMTTRTAQPRGTARSVNHLTGEGRDHLFAFRRAAFVALARSEGLTGDAAQRRAERLLERWRDRTGSASPTGTFTAGTFTTKREDYR